MRTLTLLFFAVASLLIGAAAMPAVVALIDAYQAQGDALLLPGVYGYFVAAVALAAPAAFFVAALASALQQEEAAPAGADTEALAALAALAEAVRSDPNERYRPSWPERR